MYRVIEIFNREYIAGKNCHRLCRFANGATYDGEWKSGRKHGNGVFMYPDGSKYDGKYCFYLKIGRAHV